MTFVIQGGGKGKEQWKSLKKLIGKRKIGADLIQAITASQHICTVSFVDDQIVANDGGAVAGLERPELDKVPGVAMLKHFAPNDAVKSMSSADRMKDEIARGWKYYLFNNRRRNPRLRAAIQASGMNLSGIASRLRNKHLDAGLGTIDENLLTSFMDTPKPIPSELLWRLTWLLRPFMEQGKGASTQIKIAKSIGKEAAMNMVKYAWRSKWGTLKFDEGHVICFHELVHAYRIMCGARVVDSGWEEEAMTMGLPPFEQEDFTENKYRQACGMQIANMHGSGTFSSQTMAIQCQSPGDWAKNDNIFFS
ncbi:MAG: hypothetical protein ACREBW_06675 [Candidatus Micrarchaeaceae archaeon]